MLPKCQLLLYDITFEEYGFLLPFRMFECHLMSSFLLPPSQIYPRSLAHIRDFNIFMYFSKSNPDLLYFVACFIYDGSFLGIPKDCSFFTPWFKSWNFATYTCWFFLAIYGDLFSQQSFSRDEVYHCVTSYFWHRWKAWTFSDESGHIGNSTFHLKLMWSF